MGVAGCPGIPGQIKGWMVKSKNKRVNRKETVIPETEAEITES